MNNDTNTEHITRFKANIGYAAEKIIVDADSGEKNYIEIKFVEKLAVLLLSHAVMSSVESTHNMCSEFILLENGITKVNFKTYLCLTHKFVSVFLAVLFFVLLLVPSYSE